MELVVDKAGCRYVSLKIAAKIIDIVILVGMNLKETTFSFLRIAHPRSRRRMGIARGRTVVDIEVDTPPAGHQVW